MNEEERVCRRCLLLQSGRREILDDINLRIAKLSPGEKADETVYKNRLDICRQCDFLEEGTCLKCGCYPEFRAAFGKNRCPVRKWQEN